MRRGGERFKIAILTMDETIDYRQTIFSSPVEVTVINFLETVSGSLALFLFYFSITVSYWLLSSLE